ncbi:nuclear transport factor 2 family protein [Sediminitomix flava]|uniref:SnoaL-like protein n=1 Tax=Sediminitomix flava TaxID=379075 RepID=A0A315ZAG8_SEDFL|nr:nuclear transport factor 2 family protein [Sediminitomix flava]PWJ42586.1 SnoaL-like protein [Sediminitomix flava]
MIDTWHTLISSQKVVGISELLSENVMLHSPVAYRPIQGKHKVMMYLTASFYTFINDSFKYVREVRNGNTAFLEFEVVIDGTFVNGIDVIEWNEEGKITDFKVMVRPLRGVQTIHDKMNMMLESTI